MSGRAVPGRFAASRGEVNRKFLALLAYRAKAEKDAAQVSADGMTIGTAKPHWPGPSHFFRSGKLIVLCVGNDKKALRALQAHLGPPFAGG